MLVVHIHISSTILAFSLVDLKVVGFSSLFTRRGRHGLSSQARAKIHNQILVETKENEEPLPTYEQATVGEALQKGQQVVGTD